MRGMRSHTGMRAVLRRLLASAALFGLLLGSGVPIGAASGQVTLSGTFSVVIGDPMPGSAIAPKTTYRLTDAAGVTTELRLDARTLQAAGGSLALNGAAVTVAGTPAPAPTQVGASAPLLVQSIATQSKRTSTPVPASRT